MNDTPKINTLTERLEHALYEDAPNGDVTAQLCIPKSDTASAAIIAKEPGYFFGERIVETLFQIVDPSVRYICHVKDGDSLTPLTPVITLNGPTQSILLAERVLLNFIQHLSGITTITRRYVDAINNPKIKLLDTRKTTPLLRDLEKAAVRAGGGYNHRHNLSDMVLLKENHLSYFLKTATLEDLDNTLCQFKKTHPKIPVEIEIETLDALQEWPLKHVDIIMFDNFSIPDVKQGIEICQNRHLQAQIEVSGNITLETIPEYKNLDIDRISVGRLTHSIKAVDLSLLIDEKYGKI